MFDPRAAIRDLFTDAMFNVAAATTNEAGIIEVALREDNPMMELGIPDHEGIILMEEPIGTMQELNATKDLTRITILCNLWVKRLEEIKDPATFINTAITTFQTTIRTNQLAVVGNNGRARFSSVVPVPSDIKGCYRRSFMVSAYKIE